MTETRKPAVWKMDMLERLPLLTTDDERWDNIRQICFYFRDQEGMQWMTALRPVLYGYLAHVHHWPDDIILELLRELMKVKTWGCVLTLVTFFCAVDKHLGDSDVKNDVMNIIRTIFENIDRQRRLRENPDATVTCTVCGIEIEWYKIAHLLPYILHFFCDTKAVVQEYGNTILGLSETVFVKHILTCICCAGLTKYLPVDFFLRKKLYGLLPLKVRLNVDIPDRWFRIMYWKIGMLRSMYTPPETMAIWLDKCVALNLAPSKFPRDDLNALIDQIGDRITRAHLEYLKNDDNISLPASWDLEKLNRLYAAAGGEPNTIDRVYAFRIMSDGVAKFAPEDIVDLMAEGDIVRADVIFEILKYGVNIGYVVDRRLLSIMSFTKFWDVMMIVASFVASNDKEDYALNLIYTSVMEKLQISLDDELIMEWIDNFLQDFDWFVWNKELLTFLNRRHNANGVPYLEHAKVKESIMKKVLNMKWFCHGCFWQMYDPLELVRLRLSHIRDPERNGFFLAALAHDRVCSGDVLELQEMTDKDILDLRDFILNEMSCQWIHLRELRPFSPSVILFIGSALYYGMRLRQHKTVCSVTGLSKRNVILFYVLCDYEYEGDKIRVAQELDGILSMTRECKVHFNTLLGQTIPTVVYRANMCVFFHAVKTFGTYSDIVFRFISVMAKVLRKLAQPDLLLSPKADGVENVSAIMAVLTIWAVRRRALIDDEIFGTVRGLVALNTITEWFGEYTLDIWKLFMETTPLKYDLSVLDSRVIKSELAGINDSECKIRAMSLIIKSRSLRNVATIYGIQEMLARDIPSAHLLLSSLMKQEERHIFKRVMRVILLSVVDPVVITELIRSSSTGMMKIVALAELRFLPQEKLRVIVDIETVVPLIINSTNKIFGSKPEVVIVIRQLLFDHDTIVNHILLQFEKLGNSFAESIENVASLMSHYMQKWESPTLEALERMFIATTCYPDMLFRKPGPIELNPITPYCAEFVSYLVKMACEGDTWTSLHMIKCVANMVPFAFAGLDLAPLFTYVFDTVKNIKAVGSEFFPSFVTTAREMLLALFVIPSIADHFCYWVFSRLEGFSIDEVSFLLNFLMLCSTPATTGAVLAHMLKADAFRKLMQIVSERNHEDLVVAAAITEQMLDVVLRLFAKPWSKMSPELLVVVDELVKSQEPFQCTFRDSISIQLCNNSNMEYNMNLRQGFDSLFLYGRHAGTYERRVPFQNDQNVCRIREVCGQSEWRENLNVPNGMNTEVLKCLPDNLLAAAVFRLPEIDPPLTLAMHRYLVSQPVWISRYITDKSSLSYALPYEHLVEVKKVLLHLHSMRDTLDIDPDTLSDDILIKSNIVESLIGLYDMCQKKARSVEKMLIGMIIRKNSGSVDIVMKSILSQMNRCDYCESTISVLAEALSMDSRAVEYIRPQHVRLQIMSIAYLLGRKSRSYSVICRALATLGTRLPSEVLSMIVDLFGNIKTALDGLLIAMTLPLQMRVLFREAVERVLLKVVESTMTCWTSGVSQVVKIAVSEFRDVLTSNPTLAIELLRRTFCELQANRDCDDIMKIMSKLLEVVVPSRTRPFGSYEPSVDGSWIPAGIAAENEALWEVIRDNRTIIQDLVKENTTYIIDVFPFLLRFPELLELSDKIRLFRATQKDVIKTNTNDVIRIRVRRDDVLAGSFVQLKNWVLNGQLMLKDIRVIFVGEPGIDAGGLTKEWFTIITKQLFDPNYALFTQSADLLSFKPNPASYISHNHTEYFRFAGVVIARAMVEGICIDVHLTTAFLKQILQQPLAIEDLEDSDAASLHWIRENNVESLELNFTAMRDHLGVRHTVELSPNGENIPVTEENKDEFISLMVDYYLRTQVAEQIDEFLRGFYSVIPLDYISYFDPTGLDLLICGIPKIEIDDLVANCIFDRPYTAEHPVIVMFFDIIREWNDEQLAKLLAFITGSSRVPSGGFRVLKDAGFPVRIGFGGDDPTRLPVGHTCTNTVEIPAYESAEQMNEKLLYAISEGLTFELH